MECEIDEREEREDGRGNENESGAGWAGKEGKDRQGRLVVIDKAFLLMTFSMYSVVRWPLPSPGADSLESMVAFFPIACPLLLITCKLE